MRLRQTTPPGNQDYISLSCRLTQFLTIWSTRMSYVKSNPIAYTDPIAYTFSILY